MDECDIIPHVVIGKSSRLGVYVYHTSCITKAFVSSNFWGVTKLRAHFPDYAIKTIRLDNAGEFRSQSFINYCMAIGITVEEPVAHVHTQNDLAESFIKLLQLIARPLLMRTKLVVSA